MATPIRNLLLLALLWLTTGAATVAGEPAAQPQFAADTLEAGHWNLADARGHWVVINFWATWCAPCVREMPEIDAFVRGHPQVRAIGLAWQDVTPDEIRNFLRQHPVSYPIAIVDPFLPAGNLLTPRALPTTYLVDPQGRMAQTFVGPITAQRLRSATDPATAAP